MYYLSLYHIFRVRVFVLHFHPRSAKTRVLDGTRRERERKKIIVVKIIISNAVYPRVFIAQYRLVLLCYIEFCCTRLLRTSTRPPHPDSVCIIITAVSVDTI